MKKDPLLLLKIVVYGMGILLVCGFVWLGIQLTMKASEMNSTKCAEITLPEPPLYSGYYNGYFNDGYWIMDYVQGRDHLLLRYDGCGKLVQKVKVPQ